MGSKIGRFVTEIVGGVDIALMAPDIEMFTVYIVRSKDHSRACVAAQHCQVLAVDATKAGSVQDLLYLLCVGSVRSQM